MSAKINVVRFMGASKTDDKAGAELPLASIIPSKTNRQIDTGSDAFKDLVSSVSQWGVYQPILVRRAIQEDGDATFYEIIAGERRYLASKVAGKTHISAIIRPEVTDVDALALQITENIQREDYQPLVLAEKLLMLKEMGKSTAELAGMVGKSEKRISDILCQLHLIAPTREIYVAGRISYGHVMYIARLAPAVQEKALRAVFRIPESDKVSTPNLVARIKSNDNMHPISEKDLRAWVNEEVNLKLKVAAWKLEDVELLPEAGPCTTCPKRSINNPELYSEVAGTKDLCMDPACYRQKAHAFVKIQKAKAKEEEVEYLRLSDKESHSLCVDKAGTIKRNQWVPAKKGECKDSVQGILVDGPSAGRKPWVCINEKCKTHAHDGIWNSSAPATRQTEAQLKENQEKIARERDEENAFRRAVLAQIIKGPLDQARALRAVLLDSPDERLWRKVAELYEWPAFPASGNNMDSYIREKLEAMSEMELTRTLLLLHCTENYDETEHYWTVNEDHQQVVDFVGLLGITPNNNHAAATAITEER